MESVFNEIMNDHQALKDTRRTDSLRTARLEYAGRRAELLEEEQKLKKQIQYLLGLGRPLANAHETEFLRIRDSLATIDFICAALDEAPVHQRGELGKNDIDRPSRG
jgi:hypothetical protein